MKFEDVNDEVPEDIHKESGEKMMKIMADLQRDAEMSSEPKVPVTQIKPASQIKSSYKQNDDKTNYFEIKDIPTKYKLYPEGTLIEARPLKVIEVKKLSSLNSSNADYIINDILKRTVRGISIEDIYLADKLYIIFWLRAKTFRDSSYTVDFKCPKCDKDSMYHFELNNLKINFIEDDYDPDKLLKIGDNEITLKYLTVSDELKVERFKEINSKLFDEIDDELLGLACMLHTIDGKVVEDILEKYYYVLELDPQDYSYISTYIDKYFIGVDPIMNVECKLCGGTAPMGISFRGDFFFPKCTIE